MEMIVSVLIFSISAAVCVQIFAKAYILSENTQDLGNAVSICTSAAELFYGYRGDLSKIQQEMDPLHSSQSGSGSLTFYYNENYSPDNEGNARFRLDMNTERADDLLKCTIKMSRLADNKSIYRLNCTLFLRTSGTPSGNFAEEAPAADMPDDTGAAMGGVL